MILERNFSVAGAVKGSTVFDFRLPYKSNLVKWKISRDYIVRKEGGGEVHLFKHGDPSGIFGGIARHDVSNIFVDDFVNVFFDEDYFWVFDSPNKVLKVYNKDFALIHSINFPLVEAILVSDSWCLVRRVNKVVVFVRDASYTVYAWVVDRTSFTLSYFQCGVFENLHCISVAEDLSSEGVLYGMFYIQGSSEAEILRIDLESRTVIVLYSLPVNSYYMQYYSVFNKVLLVDGGYLYRCVGNSHGFPLEIRQKSDGFLVESKYFRNSWDISLSISNDLVVVLENNLPNRFYIWDLQSNKELKEKTAVRGWVLRGHAGFHSFVLYCGYAWDLSFLDVLAMSNLREFEEFKSYSLIYNDVNTSEKVEGSMVFKIS